MLELDRGKSNALSFKLDISGTSAKPEVRMIFPAKEGYSIVVNGSVEGDIAKVEVDPSKQLVGLPESIVGSYLEVIVDGAYFIPWKDDVVIREGLQVGASMSGKGPRVAVTEAGSTRPKATVRQVETSRVEEREEVLPESTLYGTVEEREDFFEEPGGRVTRDHDGTPKGISFSGSGMSLAEIAAKSRRGTSTNLKSISEETDKKHAQVLRERRARDQEPLSPEKQKTIVNDFLSRMT